MKLKELRQKNNLSQAEMAKILNTTQKTISNYEKELTDPPINMLTQLADYFHVTIDSLLEHDVPYLLDKSKFSQQQQKLIERIVELSDENCNRVNDFLDGILIAENDKQTIIQKYKGV